MPQPTPALGRAHPQQPPASSQASEECVLQPESPRPWPGWVSFPQYLGSCDLRTSRTTSRETGRAPQTPAGIGWKNSPGRVQTGSLGTPLPLTRNVMGGGGGDSSSALASGAWHWAGAKWLLAPRGNCFCSRETAPDSSCFLHPSGASLTLIHSLNKYLLSSQDAQHCKGTWALGGAGHTRALPSGSSELSGRKPCPVLPGGRKG